MGLGQSARSDTEGTLDDPRRADDAALGGEYRGLVLAQRSHHVEALDRGVGRRPRPATRARGRINCLSLPWSTSMTLLRYFSCLCLPDCCIKRGMLL